MTLPWKVKYWNGTTWQNSEQRRWDGSNWQASNAYYFDGSQWVLMTDRTPPTQTYTQTYNSLWGGSYKSDNSRRTDSNGLAHNYQGNSSNGMGSQRCMWGYGTQQASDVAGAVAYYWSQVYMVNMHTYYAAGGTADLGIHNQGGGSVPGTYSETGFDFVVTHFDRGQSKWVDTGTTHIANIASGAARGFTLRAPGSSSDVEYYGYYANYGTFQMSYEK